MRTAGAVSPPLLFRAFADTTRLRILCLLRQRELCVGDLVSILRVPQATVSRHLTYLRRARLVGTRRAGLWIHYSLAPAAGALHGRLLSCLATCAAGVAPVAADRRRYLSLRKRGGCCPR
jgi:ArsR family transcriptional regulator